MVVNAGLLAHSAPGPKGPRAPEAASGARFPQGRGTEVVCPLCQSTALTASYIGLTNKRDQRLCGFKKHFNAGG
jgi:hypothetical protein